MVLMNDSYCGRGPVLSKQCYSTLQINEHYKSEIIETNLYAVYTGLRDDHRTKVISEVWHVKSMHYHFG